MPGRLNEKLVVRGASQRTFHAQLSKLPLKVINCREKYFHVKDKFLCHADGIEVLSAAHVS